MTSDEDPSEGKKKPAFTGRIDPKDPFGFGIPPTGMEHVDPQWPHVTHEHALFFLEVLNYVRKIKTLQALKMDIKIPANLHSFSYERTRAAFEQIGADYDALAEFIKYASLDTRDSLKVVQKTPQTYDASSFIEDLLDERLNEEAKEEGRKLLEPLFKAIHDERFVRSMIEGSDAPPDASPW